MGKRVETSAPHFLPGAVEGEKKAREDEIRDKINREREREREMCVRACVGTDGCMCERERERGRERKGVGVGAVKLLHVTSN